MIYRVDPGRFQTSGNSSAGDLSGLARRLDYLQSLGVDAILLATPGGEIGPGSEDLIRDASQHRLRVLIEVGPELLAGDRNALLGRVHEWLGEGAAGISVAHAVTMRGEVGSAADAGLLAALGNLVRSYPGGRVLLSDPFPRDANSPQNTPGPSRAAAAAFTNLKGGELLTAGLFPGQDATAATLRQALMAIAAAEAAPGAVPLAGFSNDPQTGSPNAVGLAALLLGSRGAAIFDFGDEIGLDAFPNAAPGAPSGDTIAVLPVMQWTPSNVTQPPPAPIVRETAPAPQPGDGQYGAYHPYVRPPAPGLTGPAPSAPRSSVDLNLPTVPPDPNTLPGFSEGRLPVSPTDGERINVATEDHDPGSVLNAYRHLVALHHGNATLRQGSEAVLNRDAQGTVVWLHRAPANGAGAGDVVGAVNLTGGAVTLDLDADLRNSGSHGGALRPLFTWSKEPLTGERTNALRLPPHAVFLGEIVPAASRGNSRR